MLELFLCVSWRYVVSVYLLVTIAIPAKTDEATETLLGGQTLEGPGNHMCIELGCRLVTSVVVLRCRSWSWTRKNGFCLHHWRRHLANTTDGSLCIDYAVNDR